MSLDLVKIRNGFIKAAVAVVALSAYGYFVYDYNFYLDVYRKTFGLTGRSTVADYRVANSILKEYWLDKMCNDGVCLHAVDWKCGFSIVGHHPEGEFEPDVDKFDSRVRSCFTNLVASAPLSEPIGKLRLICGRRFMTFAGTLYSNEKKCAEVGGQWGVKLKVFPDEDAY